MHSPQYQQTLSSLTSALQSENYNSIFANFGLDPAAGAASLARGNGVEAFVAALEADVSARASGSSSGSSSGSGGGSGDSSSGADGGAAGDEKMDEEKE